MDRLGGMSQVKAKCVQSLRGAGECVGSCVAYWKVEEALAGQANGQVKRGSSMCHGVHQTCYNVPSFLHMLEKSIHMIRQLSVAFSFKVLSLTHFTIIWVSSDMAITRKSYLHLFNPVSCGFAREDLCQVSQNRQDHEDWPYIRSLKSFLTKAFYQVLKRCQHLEVLLRVARCCL